MSIQVMFPLTREDIRTLDEALNCALSFSDEEQEAHIARMKRLQFKLRVLYLLEEDSK